MWLMLTKFENGKMWYTWKFCESIRTTYCLVLYMLCQICNLETFQKLNSNWNAVFYSEVQYVYYMLVLPQQNTVKHAKSECIYKELTLVMKLFSFPVSFKHIVKLRDITNYMYIYNKAKSPVPGTLLKACFTVTVNFIFLKTYYIEQKMCNCLMFLTLSDV